jgi:hypothetical protein
MLKQDASKAHGSSANLVNLQLCSPMTNKEVKLKENNSCN